MQLPSNEQRENCRSLGDLVLMRIVSCLVAARYASDQAGGFSLAIEALPLESASPSRPCPLAPSRSAGDPHADAAPPGRGRGKKKADTQRFDHRGGGEAGMHAQPERRLIAWCKRST